MADMMYAHYPDEKESELALQLLKTHTPQEILTLAKFYEENFENATNPDEKTAWSMAAHVHHRAVLKDLVARSRAAQR